MVTQLAPITIPGGSQSPFKSPTLWDSINIAGIPYGPELIYQGSAIGGLVRVKKAARKYKIDIKDAKGSDGWTITYRGVRPKKFTIELLFWTDDQYNYLVDNMIPAVLYSGAKGNVQPLGVIHPGLNALAINSIFVEEIGAPEEIREDHLFSISLDVAEYLQPPPQNTTSTPIGAKTVNSQTSNSKGIQPNPAIVAALAAKNRLQDQAIQAGLPNIVP